MKKQTKGWINATWNLAYLEALRENRRVEPLRSYYFLRYSQGKLF